MNDSRARGEASGRHEEDAGPAAPDEQSGEGHGVSMSYRRFGAMIATSGVAMFVLMYLNTYAWSHVEWSETRFYMTFVMVSVMAVIMLAFMLGMYRDRRANIAIFVAAALVFGGALWLVRSQATVQDESYLRAMIPHHSIAILTSERSGIRDVRVRELADEIIEAQRREIAEMEWLLQDIADNGEATTAEQAAERPVPSFEASP
jgi:hypothetical protein